MTFEDLEAKAQQLLDQLMAKAPMRHRPSLVWKRLRVSAGMAYFQINTIGLSRVLITDEVRLNDTLTHEFAHLLAFERHGKKAAGHGPLWKQTMIELGQPPSRTHSYEVQRNSRRQEITYACKRCGATFQRSKRFPRFRKYVHVRCGGFLQLIEVRAATNEIEKT